MKKRLTVVDFSTKEFKEIPKQDNPAYISKDDFERSGFDGCILICKVEKQKAPYINMGRYKVLSIEAVENPNEQESVTNSGLFWEHKEATDFANILANRDQFTIDEMESMCIESLDPEDYRRWVEIQLILRNNRELLKELV